MQETLQSIKLSDYKKPNYHIESVHLTIDLDLKNTKIISKMQLKQQSDENTLYLHGEELELCFCEARWRNCRSS